MKVADGMLVLAVLALTAAVGCEKKDKHTKGPVSADRGLQDTAEQTVSPNNSPQNVSAPAVGTARPEVKPVIAVQADVPGKSTQSAQTGMANLAEVRKDVKELAQAAVAVHKALLNASLAVEHHRPGQGEQP